jgi:hypothetical protein
MNIFYLYPFLLLTPLLSFTVLMTKKAIFTRRSQLRRLRKKPHLYHNKVRFCLSILLYHEATPHNIPGTTLFHVLRLKHKTIHNELDHRIRTGNKNTFHSYSSLPYPLVWTEEDMFLRVNCSQSITDR